MDEGRRDEAVQYLVKREGIDEVLVFSTCNRTEFYVWSHDASEASNSILRFLTRCYDLKLAEWSNFYRLVDDAAMIHILRVASGLDTHVFGDPDVVGSMKMEWNRAKHSGTTGQVLDSVMEIAISTAERVRREAWAAAAVVPLPFATVQQCRDVFTDLKSRRVLVLGSGQVAGAVVSALKQAGVERVGIASPAPESDIRLARETASVALPYGDCAQEIFSSDIVICALDSKQPMLTAAGLDPLMRSRVDRHLLVVDLGVPRNVESAVRGVPGVFLLDTDDLSDNVQQRVPTRPSSAEAEDIVRQEAANFRRRLQTDGALPVIAALRHRLDELCAAEFEYLAEQYGPFTEDQTNAVRAFGAHITQRISAALARQLTQVQGKTNPDPLAEAIEQLFQLPESVVLRKQ
jgi:glutamyl-tRNA reductase